MKSAFLATILAAVVAMFGSAVDAASSAPPHHASVPVVGHVKPAAHADRHAPKAKAGPPIHHARPFAARKSRARKGSRSRQDWRTGHVAWKDQGARNCPDARKGKGPREGQGPHSGRTRSARWPSPTCGPAFQEGTREEQILRLASPSLDLCLATDGAPRPRACEVPLNCRSAAS